MKLKCPACSQILSVPETAAGKLIQCPCGQQLMAPAESGSARNPAAQRPSPQNPASRPAAASPSEFDDLTDTDLQPIRGVSKPGLVVPRSRVKEDQLLLKLAGKEGAKKGAVDGSHPTALKMVSGWSFIFAVVTLVKMICVIGLTNVIESPAELMSLKGFAMVLVIIYFTFDILTHAMAGTACFFENRYCWLFIVATFSSSLVLRCVDLYDKVRFQAGSIGFAWTSIALLLGLVFLAYLLSDEVRAFFKTRKEPLKWTLASVGGGLATGLLLGGLYLSNTW